MPLARHQQHRIARQQRMKPKAMIVIPMNVGTR
jgi:hypothetical protein